MIAKPGRRTSLVAALACCLVAAAGAVVVAHAGAPPTTNGALLAAAGTLPPAVGAPAAPGAQPAGTLVPTPPMGVTSGDASGCDVSHASVTETADALVSTGLAEAGYAYVVIDDCWSLPERDADGRLVPDPGRFPDGISAVADHVHGKGLKLGIHGDAGPRTCAGRPGSLSHEETDARTWAQWGVDYLRYDTCDDEPEVARDEVVGRYTAMRDALEAAGRPIAFAICDQGRTRPWEWAAGGAGLWCTGGDIGDDWAGLRSAIAGNARLHPYAGPGRWNDPGPLEVGNGGMTADEYRTQMSMWAMMAAPLMISTDPRTASEDTLSVLGHPGVIAIDQDPLGAQGTVVPGTGGTGGPLVLDKPLADGDRAIALHNPTDTLATVGVPAAGTGLAAAGAYQLTDVWSGEVRQSAGVVSAAVPAHGTVVYRVRPLAEPATVAPSVTVGLTLGPVVSGGDRAVMTIAVVNRGVGEVYGVSLRPQAPPGWTVGALGHGNRARMATDEPWTTRWGVQAPEGTPAGRYPITITATYTWGPDETAGTSSSEIVSTVVVAPPDGRVR